MDNSWAPTVNYPGYLVSPDGEVMHERLERLINPHINNWGSLVVQIKHPTKRGYTKIPVARLVGEAYVDKHEPIGSRPYEPDVLIHKDLDRTNCSADNLEWRYRFYGIQYHQLATRPGWGNPYLESSECPWRNWILYESTFDEYGTVAEFSQTYGLLPANLLRAAITNRTNVMSYSYDYARPEQIYTFALLKVITPTPLDFIVHEKKYV